MASAPPPVQTAPGADLDNATTRRGIGVAAFCLGFWSLAVFWWYPYSLFIAAFAIVLGGIATVTGWKGGKDGEPLGLYGIGFASVTIGASVAIYRGVQLYFEGIYVINLLP